ITTEDERTVYVVLAKDFCNLNYNIARKIILSADVKLKNKSLNFMTTKDLNKQETDVLFKIFSKSVETEVIISETKFLNFLKSGKSRTITSLLQSIKGIGKNKVAEIIEKVDEKLHYNTLLTVIGNKLTNKEVQAIYDSLMEIEKCPAAVTINMMDKLLKSSSSTNLGTFLSRNFMDINRALADQLVEETNTQLGGNISLYNIPPNSFNEDQMNALFKAFISEKYLAPPTDTVVPVGAEILERVIKKNFDPQFVAAETRSPTSGKGLAFAVEVALAYGGKIKEVSKAADILHRFVNRTPKLRDNSDCVIWKTVSKVNWKNYKVDTFDNGIPKGRIRIFVNISGPFVHVMFKSQSKQALAEDDVLKREIQLGLESIGRRLKSFLLGREVSKRKARRALILLRNVKKFAASLYNVECIDFTTGEVISGKPSLEEIETNLSRPIKDNLKSDVRSVLSKQWSTLTQIIEDLGLETLRDKFVKNLITEILGDLSTEYNVIIGASPKEIIDIFQNQDDPYIDKLILETLQIQEIKYTTCESCNFEKDKSTCSFFNSEYQECPIEQNISKSFIDDLKNTYELDPLNDEILLEYLGMLEVQIERNQRINKSVTNLVAQKKKFLADLKANPSRGSGISRVKNGAALAFSDIMKNEKDKLFWRIQYPKIKDVIQVDEFTIEDLLEMTYSNLDGGLLTKKDDFVK
ncbi:MAG: hypothetical protein ACFFD2_08840, partial [Promethearchaeota archaeon]